MSVRLEDACKPKENFIVLSTIKKRRGSYPKKVLTRPNAVPTRFNYRKNLLFNQATFCLFIAYFYLPNVQSGWPLLRFRELECGGSTR